MKYSWKPIWRYLLTCLYGCLCVLLPHAAICQQDLDQEIQKMQDHIRSQRIRSETMLFYDSKGDSVLSSIYEVKLYNTRGELVYAEAQPCCDTYLGREIFDKRDQMIRNTDSTGNFSKSFIHRLQKSPRSGQKEGSRSDNGSYLYYSYDQEGRKVLETSFEPEAEIPWERNHYAYDTSGNLISRQLFIGHNFNDLTQQYDLQYRYDSAGRKILQYEPRDSIVYTYDTGRLLGILRYGTGPELGGARIYTYSDSGYTVSFKENVQPLTDGNIITKAHSVDELQDRGYERYDTAHRLLESHMLNYDMHTVYVYDAQGKLLSQIYNNSSHTDFEYDQHQRKSAMQSCLETSCNKSVYLYNEQGELKEERRYIDRGFIGKYVLIYTYFR